MTVISMSHPCVNVIIGVYFELQGVNAILAVLLDVADVACGKVYIVANYIIIH